MIVASEVIEKMFNEYCDNRECVSCNCQVLPDEKYENCFLKYKDIFLAFDIENRINIFLRGAK